jgi:hypothetical protein
MDAAEVAEGAVAWVRGLIPEIKSGVPYPEAVTLQLPDVWAVVQSIRTVPSDQENFPGLALEAVWLKEWGLEISMMVEQKRHGGENREGETEDDAVARETQDKLQAFAETLIGSALSGVSLGDGVGLSPKIEAALGEPFNQRDDGTRGREVVVTCVAAQAVGAPV